MLFGSRPTSPWESGQTKDTIDMIGQVYIEWTDSAYDPVAASNWQKPAHILRIDLDRVEHSGTRS